MGNQHSAPDKDKDKDKERELKTQREKDIQKEKERDVLKQISRHERHRSRTISTSSTPIPPTESKINAEPRLAEQKHVEKPIVNATLKERRPIKDTMISDVKKLELKDLPRPSAEDIVKDAATTEPTPKFETMRVASQSSIVDEEELKEADKSGLYHYDRN
jgi:hypothetical protein